MKNKVVWLVINLGGRVIAVFEDQDAAQKYADETVDRLKELNPEYKGAKFVVRPCIFYPKEG